ncbi:transcriptional regulator PpsR [Sulfitobacter guttiformis]|nr:transcriptional regulator PpsR [Sulfitobacter guttiformis]
MDDTWTSGLIPLIGAESFTDIIGRVADLGIVMSRDGKVLGVFASQSFRRKDVLARYEGRQLRDTFANESIAKFDARLNDFLTKPEPARSVELNHKGEDGHDGFPVRYSFHEIGESGKILMMGRDLRSIAEMQQQLVAAQLTLEKDYEARREHDMQFRVLMASIDDAMIFVSLPDGTVKDCNPAARVLLGKQGGDLVGVSLDQLLEHKDKSKGALVDRLVGLANENAATQITIKSRTPSRIVSLRPVLFRNGGDQAMLCRIVTTAPEALKSDSLQSNLTGLYERGADAIVFVDTAGTILSANEAFLNLADVTHGKALKGRSIVDFLGRGSVDLNVMIENAARSGMMRAYTTRVTGEFGAERAVEVSTTHVQTGAEAVFALILRDISRVDNTRTETKQLGEVDMQSVIELIGSQSLRDIVAKTTDVVEKMCIETAVELTSNNRVAAAEMLGLSRQSLYVKLRKYDLLKSGT